MKREMENDNFDIEYKNEKIIYSEENILGEYSFLRFLEEIGYPYAIGYVNLILPPIILNLMVVCEKSPIIILFSVNFTLI